MDGSSECDSQGDPTAPPRLGTCLEWGPAEGESLWFGSARSVEKAGGVSSCTQQKQQGIIEHNFDEVMPELLEDLPDVDWLLANNLPVTGMNFFESMCGCAGTTIAMMWNRVPCIKPWDIKFGNRFDVLT